MTVLKLFYLFIFFFTKMSCVYELPLTPISICVSRRRRRTKQPIPKPSVLEKTVAPKPKPAQCVPDLPLTNTQARQ